jgi:2-polyprenyl-3-methyl-5-hydroxy-6-metoxy-1,4-benzoquinol methylase
MEPFRALNRLVEIGPGRGWFLAEAARAGWETWAVEVNEEAISRLEASNLHRVIVSPAEGLELPRESVDAVRMWDVIEHLASPRRALENLSQALRPGGLLRLATTNFASLSRWVNGPEWVYLNGADHIVLFEPATITRLLESAGLTVRGLSTRSFNLRRKLYHPERDLPARQPWLKPLRKLIDAMVGITPYGHHIRVTAVKER